MQQTTLTVADLEPETVEFIEQLREALLTGTLTPKQMAVASLIEDAVYLASLDDYFEIGDNVRVAAESMSTFINTIRDLAYQKISPTRRGRANGRR